MQRIPDQVRDQLAQHGLHQFHHWPLASHGRTAGEQFEPPSRPGVAEAWSWPYIELQPPNAATCIVLDVDHAAELDDVPRPSWFVANAGTNRRQVVYVLEAPVHRSGSARTAPLMFYRRVAEGLRRQACADACSTISIQVTPRRVVKDPASHVM